MITKSTRMKIFSDRKMPAKRIKPDREVELNEKGCPMQKSRARPVQIIARNRGQNFISKIQGFASSDSANKRGSRCRNSGAKPDLGQILQEGC